MTALTLDAAESLIDAALAKGSELGLKPLAVAVLDEGGHLKAFRRQDGASLLRPQIAHGKAYGALSLGMGSRAIMNRAEQQAYFIGAVANLAPLVPVPGGVLITADGAIIGAVGITGDTSDNDEAAAIAGIEAAGFTPDAG